MRMTRYMALRFAVQCVIEQVGQALQKGDTVYADAAIDCLEDICYLMNMYHSDEETGTGKAREDRWLS